MKRLKTLAFVLILIHCFTHAIAQEKVEKEESIQKSEVNSQALSFVEAANFGKKIRWYKEYGIKKESIEAKVKFRRNWFSIEFDSNGNLEDIEQVIKFRKLPKNVRTVISDDLAKRFDKFRVLRTQLQWLEDPKTLLTFFNDKNGRPAAEGYELEVEGFLDGKISTYEVTCTNSGEILSVLQYVPRPTDNLDF